MKTSSLLRQWPGLLLGLGALGLLPLAAWWIGEPFYIGLFSRIMIFALAVLSLDLILGYGGMISFGHAAFLGIGAYVVGILAFHGLHSGWLQWPLAILTAAGVALIIGAISLATSGVYFIMITLAFSQMLYFAAQSLEKYGGDDGMTLWSRSEFGGLVPLSNAYVFYYVVLGILLGCLYLSWRLVHSRFGMVLQGIRENERRMQALGFPTYRYKLTGFVIAGGIAGLAGALLANQAEFVSPSFLHWSRSGEMLFMVTLGGMGTLFGPMLGTTAFLLLEEVISSYTAHWKIIFGPLLVVFVLFVRRGLYGMLCRGQTRSGPLG